MLTMQDIHDAEVRRWTERYEQVERWRSVVGYEGIYEVSNLGRLRSLSRVDARGHRLDGRIMPGRPHPVTGHIQVTLTRQGECETKKVHRLVLETFVGPCPEGMEACHGNGIPADNRVANLRWDTHEANAVDRARHGTQAGARQWLCARGHRIEGPNIKAQGNRRRCRACALERGRSGAFDRARADRTYAELMGEVD